MRVDYHNVTIERSIQVVVIGGHKCLMRRFSNDSWPQGIAGFETQPLVHAFSTSNILGYSSDS